MIFILSILLFVMSQIVTVASRRVVVRDKDHQIIGDAWIPHDYGTHQFLSFSLMVVCGIQFWTVLHIGRNTDDTESNEV